MLSIELNKGCAFISSISMMINNQRINCLEIIDKDLYIDADMIWKENEQEKIKKIIKFVKNVKHK